MMMRADMVYQYPIWAVGLSLVITAVVATMLLEIAVRRFLSADFRRQHNDIAAAILSIIGVTYAVLLAFVATLAWEDFNKAKAASHSEAAVILDVFDAANGFANPARADLIAAITSVGWVRICRGVKCRTLMLYFLIRLSRARVRS